MGKPKKSKVSKQARTRKDDTRFDKSKSPGPEFVWHESFEYKTTKGSVIRVRGHWERNLGLVKPKAKPQRAKRSDNKPADPEAKESASNGLLALAKAKAAAPVPIKKEAKAGEGGA